jgi:hypothetical protein
MVGAIVRVTVSAGGSVGASRCAAATIDSSTPAKPTTAARIAVRLGKNLTVFRTSVIPGSGCSLLELFASDGPIHFVVDSALAHSLIISRAGTSIVTLAGTARSACALFPKQSNKSEYVVESQP